MGLRFHYQNIRHWCDFQDLFNIDLIALESRSTLHQIKSMGKKIAIVKDPSLFFTLVKQKIDFQTNLLISCCF